MWGFLGAGVADTPDGSRAYRRAFVDGLVASGVEVIFLQTNRDLTEAGVDLRERYRWEAGFPPLDAVIFEWRWPLPGRNTTACGSPGHTCDLHRQDDLFEHYTRWGTRTLIWDLDRQLPEDDGRRGMPNIVVGEFALRPTPGAVSLFCPVPDRLLDTADPKQLAVARRSIPLVYVGNQYDRDGAFERYFAPAAAAFPHRVAGKWKHIDAWPHIAFTGRCPFLEVEQIHREALATVLLLPRRYAQVGHMTSRWFEALLAGCLTLLPSEVYGADVYTPPALQVTDGQQVIERLTWLQRIAGSAAHVDLLAACLAQLGRFRCTAQVATALNALEALG